MPGFLPSPPLGRVREITPEHSGVRWPPYTVLAIQSDSGIHPVFRAGWDFCRNEWCFPPPLRDSRGSVFWGPGPPLPRVRNEYTGLCGGAG